MTPKILYICPGSFGETHGVIQKVTKRVEFWQTQGFETKVVTYKDIHFNWFEKILLRLPLSPIHVLLYFVKFPLCVKRIQKDFKANIIYTRHFPAPFLMPKDAKLILEVNGDINKLSKNDPFIMRTLVRKSIEYYNKNCTGLVLVGDGLETCFNVKDFIIIPNSILATSDTVLKNFQNRAKNKQDILLSRKIIFLATKNRSYYSLNTLMKTLSSLKKPIQLVVVGSLTIREDRIPEDLDVTFTGPLYGEELAETLRSALVGFGVLSVSTVLDGTASPLKTRSYLQNALPVYTENNDIDFPSSSTFFNGTDYSPTKKPSEYAKELDSFIQDIEDNSFKDLEKLPSEIERICLDHRELKTLNFFKELL